MEETAGAIRHRQRGTTPRRKNGSVASSAGILPCSSHVRPAPEVASHAVVAVILSKRHWSAREIASVRAHAHRSGTLEAFVAMTIAFMLVAILQASFVFVAAGLSFSLETRRVKDIYAIFF